MDKLVPGSLLNIFTNNDLTTPFYAQIHQSKIFTEGQAKIRMMLNDSKYCINAIFKPNEFQNTIDNFAKFSYIYISNFNISLVNGKFFLVLNKCEIISNGEKFNDNYQLVDNYLKLNPNENRYQKYLDDIVGNVDLLGNENEINNNNNNSSTSTSANTNTNNNTNTNDTTIPKLEQKPNINNNTTTKPNSPSTITLDQLSPYQSEWTIKVRVSYKSDMKTWKNAKGEGKLFSVHFMDQTSEIKATAFNDSADMFYDLLQENNAYYISKASIRASNKTFNSLKNEHEIILEKSTIIKLINDDSNIPKVQFNFIKLNEIETIENNQIIDVLGILKNIDEKKEIISKSTGKPYDRRDITIVDQSQMEVNVGLWNKYAREFNLNPGTPIAIKGCKVNEFNGKQLSLIPSATIFSNPNLPEAYKLKGWYDNEGSIENFKSLKNSIFSNSNNNLNSKDSILHRTSIKLAHEMKLGFNEKPDYFTIKASVSFIKPDNFSYPSCSTDGCSKKVIEQNDLTWRCERCEINHKNPLYRYILSASVVDETGQMWINLFNEQGETLLGCDAKTLLEIKDSGIENSLRDYLTNKVLYKEFNFRIRARMDSYQGVDKARFQVVGLSEVDPSSECDALIDLIDKLNV